MTYCYGLIGVRRGVSFATELHSQYLPNLINSISRIRRQEIVNFKNPTPSGDNLRVNLCISLKVLFSTPGHRIGKLSIYTSSIDDQGRV